MPLQTGKESVFIRPWKASGLPEICSIGTTGISASFSTWAVRPVATISAPLFLRARARGMMPSLSETVKSARRILSLPGILGLLKGVFKELKPLPRRVGATGLRGPLGMGGPAHESFGMGHQAEDPT